MFNLFRLCRKDDISFDIVAGVDGALGLYVCLPSAVNPVVLPIAEATGQRPSKPSSLHMEVTMWTYKVEFLEGRCRQHEKGTG